MGDNGTMPTPTDLRLLMRHPVDLRIGDTPEESRFVFSGPDGPVEVTASEALGTLSQGIRVMNADPTARAWATPAILALRLMAAGRLSDPDSAAAHQLSEAGRVLDPSPARGQQKIQAFLAALAVDAPAVATRERDGHRTPPATPRVERASARPRHFAGTLVVTLRARPDAGAAADLRLRVKPLDAAWAAVDASDVWRRDEHHFGAGSRPGIRSLVSAAATAWKPVGRLLADLEGGAVTLTADEVGELALPRVVAALRAQRVEVVWPDDVVTDLETAPTVSAPLPAGASSSDPQDEAGDAGRVRAFSADQLFRFDWNVALGGDRLTREELDTLADSQHGLVRVRDQWVLLSQRTRDLARDRGRDLSAWEALRAGVSGRLDVDDVSTEVATAGWLDDLRKRLADRGESHALEAPAALSGSLRDYQLDGLRWMAQLADLGLGGILADDMGLGKTIMLISLHLHRAELAHRDDRAPRPTLVVCPASVVANWEAEIGRFAPGQAVRRFHGTGRTLEGVHDGFVVTTYATFRRDVERLRALDWELLVADEAQNVKNVRSGAAKALRTVRADLRFALTGTPVENHLGELWAILDWTTPGLLGGHEEFRRRWSRPIERHGDDQRAADLARLVRPFVLRRRKSDPGIAPELPPKTESDYRVHLTREQVALYETVVRETMEQIGQADGMQRRGLVVKLLTQLKQICNHPAHFLRQSDGRLAGRSGKLTVLGDLLTEIVAEDGSVLLFTQYAQMGRLLTRFLDELGLQTQFLHGGTPVAQRERMVERFQAGRVPVFVLSLKAAGTGLNLTRAEHVVHVDRWWNPAVENQATDRAHRIGQTRPVHVHRFLCEGTIEESISDLIAAKRDLADAVVDGGEAALTELTDTELAELVRLRR